MNYIWSKKSLLEFIESSIWKIVKRQDYTFSDLFAGTGIVWSYFKARWHKVIANDLQYYSFVLNKNYIGNNYELTFDWLNHTIFNFNDCNYKEKKDCVLEYLNQLQWQEGFIYKNYALWGTLGKDFERQYFSDKNAKKCDAVRIRIEQWKNERKITSDEYFFLLASLLESIDKVANTASVYWAFLKKLKKSAQSPMILKSANFICTDKKHEVCNKDINELIKSTKHDVVYLDPPYNTRQYSANYHILETIAKYDNPTIKGKTGLRDYSDQCSLYSKKNEAKRAFEDLINNINANYIFVSYNSDGLMTLDEIKEIMSKRGEYGVFQKEYRRFKADSNEEKSYNEAPLFEYLHYVKIQ